MRTARWTAGLMLAMLSASACATTGGDELPVAPRADEEESPLVRILLDLHESDPNAGVVLYTLAREMDRQARPHDALRWLQRLEATPWDDLLEDDDFPNASALAAYDSVAARMAGRARVARSAETIFELHVPGLTPEGTAWDARREEVLISSGHLRKVVAVDRRGRVRDITTSAQDGLMAVLGMHVDAHDRLWVATTAAPFMTGSTPDDAGRAAIHAISLATGETVGRWEADRAPALLNDVRTAPDGAVYTTDTANGRVMRLRTESGAWSAIGEDVAFTGPNGLALNARADALFVADFHGLTRIDLASGTAERLATPPGARELGGIDGLSYTNGALIAIQNLAGKGRVWRITLDDAERTLASAELLEAGNAIFRNPTTGAVGDDGYYFLADPGRQRATGPEGPDHAAAHLRLLRIPLRGDSLPARANDDLEDLTAASDAWWALWLPPESADLALAATIEGDAVGFGYFGNALRRIDDVAGWRRRMRAWLDTLEDLDYEPIDRELRVIGDTGLEWGHYRERQVRSGGVVRRDHVGRYSYTWVRGPKGWRIVSYHRSALPDGPLE